MEASTTWVSYLRINFPLRSDHPRPFYTKDLHYFSINFFSSSPILWPTDRPTVLLSSVTLSHSACLLPRSSDRPTNRRFHLSPASPSLTFDSSLYKFPLLPDLRQSDRPTDRPSDRRSVGVEISAVWGSSVWVLPPPKSPTNRSTDGPTVCLLVWRNQPSEPFWTRRKSIGSMIEILDIKGSKMDSRGAYLLSLSKTAYREMIIKYQRRPETTLPIQSTLLIQSLFAAVYPVDIQYTKKGRLFMFPLSNFLLWFSRIYIKTKTISFLLGPSVYTSIYSQFFFCPLRL